MIKKHHFAYYFFLLTVLFIGVLVIWALSPNKNLQMTAFVALSGIYVLIGIIHHLLEHDLVGKIVVEYILVALLGIAAAFFIFKGGFGF